MAAKVYQESDAPRKFWADISAGTDFSELARKVLIAWGMEAEQVAAIVDQQLVERLVQQMQAQAGLLVIDNLETVLTATGAWQSPIYQEFMQRWIEGGTQSKLLLTSRERPALEARRTKWYGLDQGLEPEEGAALLRQLGVLGKAAELQAVSDRVGGYPLSLVLIAGWLADEEPLDPQVRYLSEKGDLFELRGLHRGQNQISVAAIFDWSFNRLSPKLQQLLTQISVYRGAFNLAAAAALIPDSEVTQPDLRQLVRRSLLQELPNRDRHNQRQFRLQPQVQTLVQQKMDDLTAAHQRAINYYQSVLQPEPWQELPDVAEYLEIFYHYCQLQQYATAFRTLWDKCDDFLSLRGYNSMRVELYQPLVTQWQPNDSEQEGFGEMLNRLGIAYRSLGQYQQAIDFHQQHLNIAKLIGARRSEANALGNLGLAYDSLGQYQQALDFHRQHLNIARLIGNQRSEAAALGNIGNAYYSLGRYQQALDFLQKHLTIAQEIGDRQSEAAALGNIGLTYYSLGQYREAIEVHQKHLTIAQEIGDRQSEAAALGNIGLTYYSLARYREAIAFYQQSLAIAQNIGDQRGEANMLGNLGIVYRFLGEHYQTIAFYQQSLAIAQNIGDQRGEATALGSLGIVYNSLGQYQQAVELLHQSLTIAQKIGDQRGEADSLTNLGLSLEQLGQSTAAQDHYQQARELYAAMGIDQWRQWCETKLQNLENS